jgi:hypothetical protein
VEAERINFTVKFRAIKANTHLTKKELNEQLEKEKTKLDERTSRISKKLIVEILKHAGYDKEILKNVEDTQARDEDSGSNLARILEGQPLQRLGFAVASAESIASKIERRGFSAESNVRALSIKNGLTIDKETSEPQQAVAHGILRRMILLHLAYDKLANKY